MPRYFIHIVNGHRIRDEQGEELPDVAAARATAMRVMTEVAGARTERFWRHGQLKVIVQDDAANDVVVLEMRDLTDPGTSG